MEKIRVLAEKNTTGIPNVIYIKGEALDTTINQYQSLCKILNVNGDVKGRYEDVVLLSYDREELATYMIKAIKEEVPMEKIIYNCKKILKNDWSYELRKKLNNQNIPFIIKENNILQIGYGEKSIDVKREEDWIGRKVESLEIPIISITGTNGKTTTARLIHNILGLIGYKSGLSSTGGIFVGNNNIEVGDTTGYYSAQEVLKSKEVNVAVLETARGGLIKKGLGFKNASVGVFTSLSEDHMGMEGVTSLSALGKIKSLIKEGLKKDGVMVLRAEKQIMDLFDNCYRIVLFENEENELIKNHVGSGGEAYYSRDGMLINNIGGVEKVLVSLNELEFAHFGLSKSNVRNIMAAIASIRIIHEDIYEIIECIKTLKCDMKTNKGRQNLIDFGEFKMMIDYGHNSEAFHEVFQIAKRLNPHKITGIITAAGDRKDEYIIDLGEVSSEYCDKIIIKEHEDKRGRRAGETAKLLYRGLINKGFPKENIKILLKEEDALREGLSSAVKGEVIVSYSQFLNLTMPIIEEYINKMNNIHTIY